MWPVRARCAAWPWCGCRVLVRNVAVSGWSIGCAGDPADCALGAGARGYRLKAAGAAAKATLDRFPDGIIRQTLLETVDFCVGRDF